MPIDKIEVPTAIVCDDLRREDNGKEFLIGVYSGDIVFPQLPGAIRVCIWMPWSGQTSTGNPTKFKLRISDQKNSIMESEFEIDTQGKDGAGTLGIGGISVRFDEPTFLTIEIKRGSEKWKKLRRIKVRTSTSSSIDRQGTNQ